MLPFQLTTVFMLPFQLTTVFMLPLQLTTVFMLPLQLTTVFMLPLQLTNLFIYEKGRYFTISHCLQAFFPGLIFKLFTNNQFHGLWMLSTVIYRLWFTIFYYSCYVMEFNLKHVHYKYNMTSNIFYCELVLLYFECFHKCYDDNTNSSI